MEKDLERDHSRTPRTAGDEEEITQLIWERERARQAKDFSRADMLREQLTSKGVTLYDKSSSWQDSSGRRGAIPKWDMLTGDLSVAGGASSSQSEKLLDTSIVRQNDPELEQKIKALVLAREQARANKDFDQADNLREELKGLNVEIYDKEKMWRTRDGLAGVVLGFYGQTPSDVEISTLVVQREKARQANNWAESDMIRDELKAWGVQIYDKEKEWRTTDGRRGPVPSWDSVGSQGGSAGVAALAAVVKSNITASGLNTAGPYPSAAAPTAVVVPATARVPVATPAVNGFATAQQATLQGQIIEAAAQLCSQGPAAAILTLQLLQQASQGLSKVAVAVPTTAAVPVAVPTTSPELSGDVQHGITFCNTCKAIGRQATDENIDWLVRLRERCRKDKDHHAADQLRNAMRLVGVEVFDKEKRWQGPEGKVGVVPMWAELP